MDTYQLTLFLLETFLLFGIPVGLILLDRKYFNKRLYILGLVFCVTLVLAVLKNWPQDTMGFTSITSYQLLWYCSALALGSILLYLADKVFIKKNQRVDFEVVLSSVALSFAQEFIFNMKIQKTRRKGFLRDFLWLILPAIRLCYQNTTGCISCAPSGASTILPLIARRRTVGF